MSTISHSQRMPGRISRLSALLLLLILATLSSLTPGALFGTTVRTSASSFERAHLLKDIRVGQEGSALTCLFVYEQRLFFQADDGLHGSELWVSDGTDAGTLLFADLVAGPEGSAPCHFAAFGGALVFVADGKLWRSDGTATGTRLIITPDHPDGIDAQSEVTAVGAQGFFTAGFLNHSLWVLDADLASARFVAEIPLIGKLGVMPISPRYALGTRLVFGAKPIYNSQQLWASDGTPAGTRQLAHSVDLLDMLGDRVLFMQFGNGEGYGAVWATDGTVEGTRQISDPLDQDGTKQYGGRSAAGRLFFVRASPGWIAVSDGTRSGTRILRQYDGIFTNLAAYQGGAFIMGQSSVWHSNGTPEGTKQVRAFTSAQGGIDAGELMMQGNRLLFSNGDAANGHELWVSDGTARGTRLCQAFNPGPASSWPQLREGSAVLDTALILAVDDGVHGEELWALPLDMLCGTTLYVPLIFEAS